MPRLNVAAVFLVTFSSILAACGGTCLTSQGWLYSGYSSCLLLSTQLKRVARKVTWYEAKDVCQTLNPWSSLASLPTDEHHNTIAAKASDGVAYWVGMQVGSNGSQPYVWMDGTTETRKPVFPGMPAVPGNGVHQVCGQMTMSILPNRRKLDWSLVDCNATQSFVCLVEEAKGSATLGTTSRTTPAPATTSASVPLSIPVRGQEAGDQRLIRMLRKVLQCQHGTAIQCLFQSKDRLHLDTGGTKLLEKSSLVLLDMLMARVTTTSMDKRMLLLKDCLQALDAYIRLWTRNGGGSVSRETVNILLKKVEQFIDSLLLHHGFHVNMPPQLSVTFKHVELQAVRVNLTTAMDTTISFPTAKIIIANGTWPSTRASNTTAVTVVSLLMSLPPIATAFNGARQQNHVVSPILTLSAYMDSQTISLQHTFVLPVTGWKTHSVNTKLPTHNTSQPECVFHTRDTRELLWSSYGCQTDVTEVCNASTLSSSPGKGVLDLNTNLEEVRCRCNHTTSFAILMSVVDVQLSATDVLVLDIVTYVGCGVSIVTSLMAITVFSCIKSLNSEKVCVHRNLCIAILTSQVVFLTGIQAVANRIICGVVAFLLHYFYMATFVWMLVEGLHLYNKVVRVFGTEKTRIAYYIGFGWGLPLLEVAVSAAIDWRGYGTGRSCWLSVELTTIWAFVGPALSILFVNFLILFAVLRIVVLAGSVESPGNDLLQVRAGVKASLFLSPLLGLTWIFGLVAVNQQLVLFQYLFSILNSLQGFFIFLYHCILNTDVRQTLSRIQNQRMLQRQLAASRSGSFQPASYSESRTAVTPKECLSPVFKRVNNNSTNNNSNNNNNKNKISPEQGEDGVKGHGMPPKGHSGRLTLIHM